MSKGLMQMFTLENIILDKFRSPQSMISYCKHIHWMLCTPTNYVKNNIFAIFYIELWLFV